ncbi:MAG: Cyclic di-GMP phosphodiesterase response regulator RpfG [Pelotomaculum sp. PtaU1.Bin065]|nr:MAG: Cyclic di-GMP phosphodiesterase response regulator RpfG [Pelotomaculum sp. PtaU1.Bin065]
MIIANPRELLKNITKLRDPYLLSHHNNVTFYSGLIAKYYSPKLVNIVKTAAYYHDVGKIGIPDAVLFKPGPLNKEEWIQMKLHPVIGSQLIEKGNGDMELGDDLSVVVMAVLYHHERMDGSGYPDGLSGENIPITSRIIAVADAFDAMTTDRPYRRAFSKELALQEIIRCAGKHFDPEIVNLFSKILINKNRKVGSVRFLKV